MRGCVSYGNVIVCSPTGFTYRTMRECPVCDKRRRFLVTLFEWYAAAWECCGCGYRFEDGYQTPSDRGFMARSRALRRVDGLRETWMNTTWRRKDAEDALMAHFLGETA